MVLPQCRLDLSQHNKSPPTGLPDNTHKCSWTLSMGQYASIPAVPFPLSSPTHAPLSSPEANGDLYGYVLYGREG